MIVSLLGKSLLQMLLFSLTIDGLMLPLSEKSVQGVITSLINLLILNEICSATATNFLSS